jgi:hypothetical protein
MRPIQFAFRIDLGEQFLEEPFPDPLPLPAPQAVVAGLPRTIPLREVAPRGAGTGDPEDAVEDLSVFLIRMADVPRAGGQERL